MWRTQTRHFGHPPGRSWARRLHVHSTLSGTTERVLTSQSYLSWYACGPTVYADAHVGHGRTYVALDMLRRLTETLTGKAVVFQLGMTDVDDKIIAAAAATDEDPTSFARKYETRFMADMGALGVRPPSLCTRVTDHIPQIITYISTIIGHGLAYAAADGVYFDVAAMGPEYGKLRPSARHGDFAPPDPVDAVLKPTSTHSKRDRRDFALWKLSQSSSSTEKSLEWDSPWGRGRPGWHIECSAMTHAALGRHLDFHAGGIDLAFPHHCNEIAQAEAHAGICGAGETLGQPWVKHWLHTGHVHIDGRKMSKSLKNFITVRAMLSSLCELPPTELQPPIPSRVLDATIDISGLPAAQLRVAADAFRWLVASYHYRSDFTYSDGRLRHAHRQVLEKADLLLRTLPLALRADSSDSVGADAAALRGVAGSWSADDWALYEAFAEAFRQVRADMPKDALATSTSASAELLVARGAVEDALRDDFDIPGALNRVSKLERLLAGYIADRSSGSTGSVAGPQREVITACGLQLARFYDMLGFAFGRRAARWLQDLDNGDAGTGPEDAAELCAGSGGSSLPPANTRPAVQAFADFRAGVRANIRTLLVQNKTDDAAGRAARQETLLAMLRGCDAIRDATLPQLGWTLKDGPDGNAVLTPKPGP